MMKYGAETGLVNGGIVSGLLGMLDELLERPFVQMYAGGAFECKYCGRVKPRNSPELHEDNCICLEYEDFTSESENHIKPITN